MRDCNWTFLVRRFDNLFGFAADILTAIYSQGNRRRCQRHNKSFQLNQKRHRIFVRQLR